MSETREYKDYRSASSLLCRAKKSNDTSKLAAALERYIIMRYVCYNLPEEEARRALRLTPYQHAKHKSKEAYKIEKLYVELMQLKASSSVPVDSKPAKT